MYPEKLSQLAAVVTFIGFNFTFFPQFILGIALLFCVWDRRNPSFLDCRQRCRRFPTQMNQGACCSNGRPTDAATAMHTDLLSGLKTTR